MTMTQTGEYSITYYNKYGERQKQFEHHTTCYLAALKKGRKTLRKREHLKSFSVDRRLYCSLDENKYD